VLLTLAHASARRKRIDHACLARSAGKVDAAANLFPGANCARAGACSTTSPWRRRRVTSSAASIRIFKRFKDPVKTLFRRAAPVGCDRARDPVRRAHIDHGRADRGARPQETAQVGELIRKLKSDGIGIFLISHDIHDVFDLADRICVMKNGSVVGTARTADVTKDEVLGMIILGKCPAGATRGQGG